MGGPVTYKEKVQETKSEKMTRSIDQDYAEACELLVSWLDGNVTSVARGDRLTTLDVDPSATFWMGRLAAEDEVAQSSIGERAERLDPCAIGIRLKPASSVGPWRICAHAEFRAWVRDGSGEQWSKSERVDLKVDLEVSEDGAAVGRSETSRKLGALGADGLSAEIRIDVEFFHGHPELVIQLVNVSTYPAHQPLDGHLYETRLHVGGVETRPFTLESLPDSFRYDRDVQAYGINVGVAPEHTADYRFVTTDNVTVDTYRPVYWNSPDDQPDLSFELLSRDPLPPLKQLTASLESWNQSHWSPARLERLADELGWSTAMRHRAREAAATAHAETSRLRKGLATLSSDPDVRRAFQLMNRSMIHSSRGKYRSWRPFQIGFLLGTIDYLVPEGDASRELVDTVWFATGGGKTETYLGLMLTNAFHDRLTGKSTGVTAWSRFPLRLLSLQQTQRFADALAGAELVRRREGITGEPFSLGFLVGKAGTPNRVLKDSDSSHPDPDSPGMPDQYQTLLNCPFCFNGDLAMKFDRRNWHLDHRCTNVDCPWPERALPFHIVDTDVYRALPTVVLGTLDKAASIGMQQAMRGLVGPPVSLCSVSGHGFSYSPRKDRPNGCLVPDCRGTNSPLPIRGELFAPSLRLQDELHLLRDSLGAVDSHYESLLDHLQETLGGRRPKIVASSATLSGHDRQVEVLYRRVGRVFPEQGVQAGDSFWSTKGVDQLRRFVAVAPRGVTLDHVSDRTISVLQESIRCLVSDPTAVCNEAGISKVHAERLISDYGTNVIYGTSLYDVEAAERSLASNTDVGTLNSVQLTGQTSFDDVRETLERLESPESEFEDRIHVIAASSMLSHGVDISRLNSMVMLGLPLSAAEFIQTTARVGRTLPGLVYVLHKIGRERDAQTFRHFSHFVTQGDRFVDPIPITRRSRRVLRLTMPGIVEARRLHLWEPRSIAKKLTTLPALRDFVDQASLDPASESETIGNALGYSSESDSLLIEELSGMVQLWFRNLEDPTSSIQWPNQLSPNAPMMSLRDVESTAPIFERKA